MSAKRVEESEKPITQSQYLSLVAKLEKAEAREAKLLEEVESAKQLRKALREAQEYKGAPMIMDPNRKYAKELQDIIAERTKGLADPRIEIKDGVLTAFFDDFGPRYRILIKGPFKRLRAPTKIKID